MLPQTLLPRDAWRLMREKIWPRVKHSYLGTMLNLLAHPKLYVKVFLHFISVFRFLFMLWISLIVLVDVEEIKRRLDYVLMFTTCFSIMIACEPNIKEKDVVASTAAFASLPVVFLSGNTKPPS